MIAQKFFFTESVIACFNFFFTFCGVFRVICMHPVGNSILCFPTIYGCNSYLQLSYKFDLR